MKGKNPRVGKRMGKARLVLPLSAQNLHDTSLFSIYCIVSWTSRYAMNVTHNAFCSPSSPAAVTTESQLRLHVMLLHGQLIMICLETV